MKKFLTFVLCFCIMFTFSVGVSFAAESTSYKSEAVKTAVENVCDVDMTKYTSSLEETIEAWKTDLRKWAYNQTEVTKTLESWINSFKEFLNENSLKTQEDKLKKLKDDAIIKFENKLDKYVKDQSWTNAEIIVGDKAEFEANVKTFHDWFINKRLYYPDHNILSDGRTTGIRELKFDEAKDDIKNLNNQINEDYFNTTITQLNNINNLKKAADRYYITLKDNNPNTYSTNAIDIAKAKAYTAIEFLEIIDETQFDNYKPVTIQYETEQKEQADANALTDAKKAAVLAITTGDYYIGNWSGKAKDSVSDIQDKYVGYINAAATIARVDEYKAEAIKLISQYKTDAQIKEENDKLNSDLDDTKAELEAVKKELALSKAMNNFSVKAKSSKTSKGYIKVKAVANTKELKDLGYTVKYKFYRANLKKGTYKYKFTSDGTYINTAGKKGKTYYYKVKAIVYDKDNNIVAQTKIKDCKYACRKFGK